ncbi:chromatin modification-related protein EAF7-domain-containing protein [Dipodascopsis uninucleata]
MAPKLDDIPPDDWNIEQETALFKAICRYKPVGMNKHFLMVCICHMVNNSFVQGSYLTTKSIWDKLNTLYNLEGLDELEDIPTDGSLSQSPPVSSSPVPMVTRHRKAELEQEAAEAEEDGKIATRPSSMKAEFTLPWNEYGELMLEHARASDSQTTSPAQLSVSGGPTARAIKRNRDGSDDDEVASAISNLDMTEDEKESERDDSERDSGRQTRRRGRAPIHDSSSVMHSQTQPNTRGGRGRGRAGRRIGSTRITRQQEREDAVEDEDIEDKSDEEKDEDAEDEAEHSDVISERSIETSSPSVSVRGRRGRRAISSIPVSNSTVGSANATSNSTATSSTSATRNTGAPSSRGIRRSSRQSRR